MSGRAESKTDSQLSQFVSLTMRVKDKLHPPKIRRSADKIKRTQSQRPKPPDLDQQPSVCVLAEQEKAVVSSLQYFKALVDRLGVDRLQVDRLGVDRLVLDQSAVRSLLRGASSRVLESVQTLVQLEPRLHNSKTVSSCLSRLYRCLAQLIRWADQVMLRGNIDHNDKEAMATVTTVIRAVLDGVKELVRLATERQDGSSPSSPDQSQTAVGQPGGCEGQQISDPAQTSQCPGAPAEEQREGTREEEQEKVSAPPKPPKPRPQLLPPPSQLIDKPSLHSAPALPPKKRQSSSGPTPCRVAIVAPMSRDPRPDRQECEEECLKRCSSLSGDSSGVETHCSLTQEEDPDYDFLLKDLSADEMFPPFPLLSSSTPPALPEKRRHSAQGGTNSQAPPPIGFDSTLQQQDSFQYNNVIAPDNHLPDNQPLSPSGTPPPLPEKKRHIHQYLQYLSSYSAPSAAMIFYKRPSTLSQHHSSRQRELETAYKLSHTHLDTQLDTHLDTHLDTQLDTHLNTHPDTHLDTHLNTHLDTHLDTQLDTHPPFDPPPVPALPPKKRQLDSALEDGLDVNENMTKDCSQSCQQEILDRITMKPEEEEGPDVKAGSPDVLLVYATELDSAEQVLYCEAFLSTYRSFTSPHDVISKLHITHRSLRQGNKSGNQRTSRNTFLLLVRVVDELCTIELDSDLQVLLMDLVFSLLIDGELGLARLLRSNILSKLEKRRQLIGSPLSLRPLSARGVAARPGTLHDFRSQDVAEQLTLMDSELFYKIELPEVLLWSKEQNEEKSPNLTEFTQHFNNVSFWVRSVIILQEKPQDREKLLLKFLKVMKHLRKLNNFNSYLSILSALDSAPLRRLDWQKHTAEALEEYSSLIDSSSSFRAYRTALAEVEPPCIPYLGLILQDLTFVHLGNPDLVMTPQGSKVNFSKRWQQFNILDTLSRYQQVRYPLHPNEDIMSFFNDFSDHLAEEALWELSLRLRPRNVPRVNQR
ncbi:rap guanine nucleotide exchange factor 1-like [Diretmus argenteus]